LQLRLSLVDPDALANVRFGSKAALTAPKSYSLFP